MKFNTLIILASIGVLPCCWAMDEDQVIVERLGNGAVLSPEELAKALRLARAGDGKAAYRLCAHYGIGVGDASSAAIYMNEAVALEYPPALYAKAVQLWRPSAPKPYLVLKLVKRAIDLGQKDTANLLPEIELFINKSVSGDLVSKSDRINTGADVKTSYGRPLGKGTILAQSELEQELNLARGGSSQAAFRIFVYYETIGEKDLAAIYLDDAVALGNTEALYIKAERLWRASPAERILIKELLVRALELGEKDAAGLLAEVEKSQEHDHPRKN